MAQLISQVGSSAAPLAAPSHPPQNTDSIGFPDHPSTVCPSGVNGGEPVGRLGRGWIGYFQGSGNMPQHYAYFPAMHGYYYFHPYHYTQVVADQEFVSSFGGDRRNPYSNDFFKVIYAEYRAAEREGSPEPIATPLPAPIPSKANQPRTKLPTVVPAPPPLQPPTPGR